MSSVLETIGIIVICAFGLVGLAIAAGVMFLNVQRWRKKIFSARLTILLISLLYQPARAAFKRVGRTPRRIELAGIELLNLCAADAFRMSAQQERMLLLPHCLRHLDCPAKASFSDGIRCVLCNKCGVAQIEKQCREKNVACYIAMGSQFARRILREQKPSAVLGVACPTDLFRIMYEVNRRNIPMIGVLLTKDGCIMTEVDWTEISDRLFET